MPLVKFNVDVSPHCKGDVVKLEGEDKKRIDAAVKARGLTDAYTEVKTTKSSGDK